MYFRRYSTQAKKVKLQQDIFLSLWEQMAVIEEKIEN